MCHDWNQCTPSVLWKEAKPKITVKFTFITCWLLKRHFKPWKVCVKSITPMQIYPRPSAAAGCTGSLRVSGDGFSFMWWTELWHTASASICTRINQNKSATVKWIKFPFRMGSVKRFWEELLIFLQSDEPLLTTVRCADEPLCNLHDKRPLSSLICSSWDTEHLLLGWCEMSDSSWHCGRMPYWVEAVPVCGSAGNGKMLPAGVCCWWHCCNDGPRRRTAAGWSVKLTRRDGERRRRHVASAEWTRVK